MNLEPKYYLECPLGLSSQCEEKDLDWRYGRKWWGCSNAYYCQFMAEAWHLPLVRESGNWEVQLTYRNPYGYSPSYYRKIMAEYGWAEAEDLLFGRPSPDSPLYVLRSKIPWGYASSVPLDKYERDILAFYCQDDLGLWWFASGKNQLPKDSSDERWQRQAQKR